MRYRRAIAQARLPQAFGPLRKPSPPPLLCERTSSVQIDGEIAVDVKRSVGAGRQPDRGALALDNCRAGERHTGSQIVIGMDACVNLSAATHINLPLALHARGPAPAFEQRGELRLVGGLHRLGAEADDLEWRLTPEGAGAIALLVQRLERAAQR